MTMAIVSMNAVANHCPVAALSPMSVMITGMATLMIVSLRMTTKEETSSRPMAKRVWPDSRCAGAAVGAGAGTMGTPGIGPRDRSRDYGGAGRFVAGAVVMGEGAASSRRRSN